MVLSLACAIAACGGAPRRGEAMPTSDDLLMKAVRSAAAARVPPSQVEARVGKPAAVNTSRGEIDGLRLRGANIYGTDPPTGEPLRWDAARDVAYWGRDIPAHNAPIVGIVWKRDGAVEVFTAFVLPP
jgi:hypothetical protein